MNSAHFPKLPLHSPILSMGKQKHYKVSSKLSCRRFPFRSRTGEITEANIRRTEGGTGVLSRTTAGVS